MHRCFSWPLFLAIIVAWTYSTMQARADSPYFMLDPLEYEDSALAPAPKPDHLYIFHDEVRRYLRDEMPSEDEESLTDLERRKLQLLRLYSDFLTRNSEAMMRKRVASNTEPEAAPLLQQQQPKSQQMGLIKAGLNMQVFIAGMCVALISVFGVAVFATALVRRRRMKASTEMLFGTSRTSSPRETLIGFDQGDKKLAHSAQMYHYQHQKQQMLAMERASQQADEPNMSDDDLVEDDSDREMNDTDYTVYECPGLASTSEMEVKNPLYRAELEKFVEVSTASSSRDEISTDLGFSPVSFSSPQSQEGSIGTGRKH